MFPSLRAYLFVAFVCGCNDTGVVFRVVSDRSPAALDSFCVELDAGGASRFGRRYELSSQPLPQTLTAVAESRDAVHAIATGFSRGLPMARDRRTLSFRGGQVLHEDLSLNVCLPSPTAGHFTAVASINVFGDVFGAVERAVLVPAAGPGAIAVAFSAGKVARYAASSSTLAPLSGDLAAAPAGAIHDLELVDVDADCRADLVVSAAGAPPSWWGRSPPGGFPAASSLGAPAGAIVASGDVDGDGTTDLVTAALGEIHLLLNDGRGGFRDSAGAFDVAPTAAAALGLGDLDGDGDLDLIVGQTGAPPLVYFSDGSGHFLQSPAALPPRNLSATSLGLADLDGDGDLDLVLATSADGARAFINRGDGFLEDRTFTLLPASTDVPGILLADLNGDCLPDAVIGGSAPQLWLSSGGGKMIVGPELGVGAISGASAEDVDGDGRLDLLLYGPRGLDLLVQK